MTIPVPRIDPAFRALIPPLSAEEYSQLEHNIVSSKKCRDALVVWDGTLVDGHNRMEICARHGITFEIKEMDFASREEAMIWILDNQLGRRNLNDAMRIELAIMKTELLRERAKENLKRGGREKSNYGKPFTKSSKPEPEKIDVHKAIATDAGVSHGTVQNYMEITKHGSLELRDAVKDGTMKIGTAHRLLDKELKKQLNLADKSFRFIERTLPKLRESAKVLPPDQLADGEEEIMQDINERIARLVKQAEALKEAYGGKA